MGLPQRQASSGRDEMEQVASKYLDLLRTGTAPAIEKFVLDYPAIAEELLDFLPLVAAMEDWKSHQEFKSIRRPMPEEFTIEKLGDCRILREIARGGMGVVFEAEQGAIARRVAVKLLPWRIPKGTHWADQFLREARTAAGLQHPHIVPVFSFGVQDDRYYYVMQLVEGVGLDKLIARWSRDGDQIAVQDLIGEYHPDAVSGLSDEARNSRRLLNHDSWTQLGKISAQIASALRYAHKQGTLHRDIKPANLLIDLYGKLWITDFGLAIGRERILEDVNEPLAGTLRYMAPEQFYGEGDERSDIYSLGVTLYELCTLKPAFTGFTKREVLEAIRTGKFIPPRTLKPSMPVAFERIILKAIATNPDHRYHTADQFHAALLSFVHQSSRPRQSLWKRINGWISTR